MQTTANISLVLTDSSSFRQLADPRHGIGYGGFYQLITSELIKDIQSRDTLRELGYRLVMVAERAHAFRDMSLLEQVSQIIVNLPMGRQFEAVGQYYQALCIHRFGRGDVERAARLLEPVALGAPLSYRIRALRSLGANSIHRGGYRTALSFYCEADRLALDRGHFDPVGTVHTQKDVAVINSLEGNHRDAVALLENLFPVARATRATHPHVYYHYLNSLAVELCEVGRLEEARNISQIVTGSPFARAYPEWRETREEIELRGWRSPRDKVSLNIGMTNVDTAAPDKNEEPSTPVCSETSSHPGTLLFMPARASDHGHGASREGPASTAEQQPARVFNLEEHKKKKMPEESDDAPKSKHTQMEINNMNTTDLLCAIMNRISDDIGDEALGRVLSLLDEIALERKRES